MDNRERVKELLDIVRESYPKEATELWNLFKSQAKPDKITEVLHVSNKAREQDQDIEINRLRQQLVSANIAKVSAEGRLTKLEKEWEDKVTLRFKKLELLHPFFSLSDKQAEKMHREFTDKLMWGTKCVDLSSLSFAMKQMCLHIGFSEFMFLQGCGARTPADLVKFRFKIIKEKE